MPVRALSALLLALALPAQTVPPARGLAELRAAFERQWQALGQGDALPTLEQQQALLRRQAAELAAFVQHEAKGDDRWHGRLLLADLRQGLGDGEGAATALREVLAGDAGGPLLLAGAELAVRLGQQPLRDELVAKALARPASKADRMAMGRVLMTHLREVEKGEGIFAELLAAATDDEQRAEVLWHRASAFREREDLPENAYYQELEKLAKDLPRTRWGGIARDRLLASQFQPGSDAIPFRTALLGGGEFALMAHQDQAVALVFWHTGDPSAAELCAAITAQQKIAGERLAVLGIAFDEDCGKVAANCRALGVSWPQACDGGGWQGELALRYHVETAPTVIVLDRQHKIVALNLHAGTESARADLAAAFARATKSGQ